MVKETLSRLGANIKGETSLFYITEVESKSITLLEKNANKMSRENFATLVKNLKKDGELSSIPLCYIDDEEKLIVISGNHRVMASREAEIQRIVVLVFKQKPTKDDILRLQLGHNAIHGQDDKDILEELLKEFEDFDNIELAGINQDYLKELPKIEKIDIGSIELERNEVVLHYNNIDLQDLKDLSESFDNVALAEVTNDEIIEIREFMIENCNIIDLSRGLLACLKMARNYQNDTENVFEEDEVPIRVGFKWGLTSKENEKRFRRLLSEYGGDFALFLDIALDLMEKNASK